MSLLTSAATWNTGLLFAAVIMTSSGPAAIAADVAPAPELDALFQAYNHPDGPGASVMVIRAGKVLFAKGYGMAEVEKQIPCGTNTNYRLASATKQFTAMAVMMLAEKKRLSLDERLTDFFPEFPPYGKEITVRHLLGHTSGLIDYEDIIPKGTAIPVLDRDVLRLLMGQDKTYFPPGAQYKYSNSAYALLALIVEARSGNTFALFLRQHIFQPLNMRNTLAYEQGLSVVPNRAYGYSAEAASFKPADQSLTSSVLGDGGIYSSVADLYQWDQALYTSKLVSAKMLQQAFTPGVLTEHPDTRYGFGWFIGSYRGLKEIWHSGHSRGFTTRITRFPEKKFTVLILTNRNDAQLADLPHQVVDLCLFPSK